MAIVGSTGETISQVIKALADSRNSLQQRRQLFRSLAEETLSRIVSTAVRLASFCSTCGVNREAYTISLGV